MDIAGLVKVRVQADLAELEAGLAEGERKTRAFDRGASGAFERTARSAKGMGDSVRGAAAKAAAANDNVTGSAARAASGMDTMVGSARRLAAAIGIVASVLATAALVTFADTWSDINARVGLAIGNMDASAQVMARIDDIARRTYSGLNLTAESFISNSTALRELGRSTREQLDYTEALNLALVVSGARGERAASVQNALSRAMALGALRGTELDTVLRSGGRVAEVLAEELGVGVNQLRALGTQGRITGDIVYNALTKRLEGLREQAELMPATIGDGLTLIGNALLSTIGRFDQASGASATLATALIMIADGIKRFGDYAAQAGALVSLAMSPLSPLFELLADNIEIVGKIATIAGAALIGAFGPIALGAVASLTVAMGTGLVGAIRAVSVAMMANPLGLFVGVIAAAITAIYVFRDEIAAVLGVDLIATLRDAVNKYVGVYVGGFNAIREVWSDLPAVLGDIAARAGQAIVNATVDAINLSIEKIKEFYVYINPFALAAKMVGFDVTPHLPGGGLTKPEVANPWKGSAGDAASRAGQAFDAAMSRDYIGALGEIIAGTRTAADATADLDAKIAATGSTSGKASKEAEKLAKAYKQIVDGAQDFVRAQHLEASLIGMSEQAANALRYEFDLLNEARRAGVELTDADRWGFKALAEAMAEAEERTRSLTDRFEFMKDLTKGFFMDFKSGLISNMQEGMSFWDAAWKSMTDAALNALQKVGERLLQLATDALINQFLGSLFKAIGGGIGGSGPSWIGLRTVTAAAAANPVSIASMPASIPQLRVPANLSVAPSFNHIPVANRGAPSSAQSAPSVVRVELSKDLEARILSQAEGQSLEIVRGYDRDVLPARVSQVASDMRAR